ncbi:hypothetical protein VHEMI09090 [[Torrubiella] hemipterigena]|uniref:Peptidase S1 domain-containing protein n=1 Tax=[Torrubiella] hemipterigena TaxID=1531966 RepID=A0A0A1TPP1_9HYPO|nr:hypothetical protein VHEMI09090 [[Torrubiella] hemipterigena]
MKAGAILGLTTSALAASIPRAADVWGGKDTAITEVPYQIEYDVNGQFDCGGSIIAKRFILTAGHCVRGQTASRLSIRAGSNQIGGGTSYKVKKINAHPKFTIQGNFIDYDVAILELTSDIALSNSAKIIEVTNTSPNAGDDALLSGWGETNAQHNYPRTLQSVHYPIISKQECQDLNNKYGAETTDRFICALYQGGGKGSCYGDSGGPLVVGGKLVGSVSGGQECAGADAPGSYADLAHPEIRPWIKQIAGV